MGLLVDSSCVLKPNGAVDAFADGSHCPVGGLDGAVDIANYGLHEVDHSFLQSGLLHHTLSNLKDEGLAVL